MTLAMSEIENLIGNSLGVFDVACPHCGPEKRSAMSQRRKVLRIWRNDDGFATFKCARCEIEGYARSSSAANNRPVDRPRLPPKSARNNSPEDQVRKARWLWSRRQPIIGSIAECYLREERGITAALPPTIGFLPANGDRHACMIAALSTPVETESGVAAADVRAVHLTKLAPDGRKADTESDKIVIGSPRGAPIALAPINDGLGLAIGEGIEDSFSVHDATGLGAWAAGSAPLLPHLAAAVPSYVECVTIITDDDKAGRRKAGELACRLEDRGFEVRLFIPARARSIAA